MAANKVYTFGLETERIVNKSVISLAAQQQQVFIIFTFSWVSLYKNAISREWQTLSGLSSFDMKWLHFSTRLLFERDLLSVNVPAKYINKRLTVWHWFSVWDGLWTDSISSLKIAAGISITLTMMGFCKLLVVAISPKNIFSNTGLPMASKCLFAFTTCEQKEWRFVIWCSKRNWMDFILVYHCQCQTKTRNH